jgi:diguanylate cyclase (GGDEF)-like protein
MYVAMLVEPTALDRLEEAFEAGVDDFLVTPIDPRHLAWRLRSTRRLLDLQARTALERTKQQEQVAKLALLTRRLRVATMFDHVTNLPNQHYLEEQLASYWEDAVDSEAELALIYIDLDGIGQINESRGHRAGSSALRQAAQALQDTLDRGAFGVRYGGDEFVVALKGTLLEGATLAQRIIDAIAADPLFEDDPIRLTASAGVTSGPAPFANADALLDAAYHALRRAKKDGGGRVRIRDPHGDTGRRAG